MEEWEAIVGRPIEPGHRTFEKTVQTAGSVLKNCVTDLAPFETEWILDTLLSKPVDLLQTVAENRGDELWFKPLCDALKLLAELVEKCDYVEKYYEGVVNLCLLNYDPELRKHALNCLIKVVNKSDVGAKNALRHISALEEASQCKTPLALLVGSICEHHPSVICNEVNRIWRTYLNMLENTKNTEKVMSSILEGVRGLFKHFGEDLPTAELNSFYENLSNKYIKIASCQSVCFEILQSYASLFRERVSQDKSLRDLLWSCISGTEAATLNVYRVVYNHVDRKVMKKIISTEVLPYTQSTNTKVKLTALRILAFTKSHSPEELTQFVDMQSLENEFRRDRVTNWSAEEIAWCVECNLPNSERLLQAAILFYDKLPSAIRKRIVVNGILESPQDVRQAAIHFLISQSCENPALIQIWRDLYDPSNTDALVEKSQIVTREFASYLTLALEMLLDEEHFEDLPPKLTSLLNLTSKVVPLQTVPLSSCGSLLCEVSESHSSAELCAALRAVLKEAAVDSRHFYKYLRIEGCRDEATLHEACLALIQAPNSVEIESNDMLLALQIIFSSDVEPTILMDALKKFDYLLSFGFEMDQQSVYETMKLVEKLRAHGDKTDRQIRILHREVFMFIGKHGSVDLNNNSNESENSVIMNLKKSFTLNLPDQGTTYKVNLQRILVLALHHENPEALQSLMSILCANLSSNKEQSTQLALTKIIQTLAKIHANCSTPYTEVIQSAIEMCRDAECVRDLLQYISASKSCGVRKLLSTALSSLCEDPDILQLTVERVNVMLSSPEPRTIRAGLDISETIISSLENNNSLCTTLLPELTVLVAKTKENDTKTALELAFKMFLDKKGLFEKDIIKNTIKNLLESLIKTKLSDVKIYKVIVKMTLNFVKDLQNVKLEELIDIMFDLCQSDIDIKVLYVFAALKNEFQFDIDVSRKIIGKDDLVIFNAMVKYNLDNVEDYFILEAILKLIEEYCQVLLELKYTETIQFISNIITKLTPKLIRKLRHNIKHCFSSLNKHWKEMPTSIRNSFQTWAEMLPLKKLTVGLEKEHFPPQYIVCVNAFKIMSEIFDVKDIILSTVKIDISKWPDILLKLFASGRLQEYFFNEMSYFNDILTVSLKFLSIESVKKLLKEGSGLNLPTKDVGILFCGYFMRGFFKVLTEKPFILLDEDVKECCVVLNDLVKFAVRKNCSKEECEIILELVDKLWPTYEQRTTFAQKHCLLINLKCLTQDLSLDSNLARWVLDTVCSRDARVEEKVKLLGFIPEEAYSSPLVTSAVTSLFPARFCELHPIMLEALSPTTPLHIDILAALAENDPTTGWWDEALDSWAAAAAQCGARIGVVVPGARATSRVLAPLLRYSSWQVCEQYFATVLKTILATLSSRPVEVKANLNYKKSIEKYMASLTLLLVAFEKLPTISLESPSSRLYTEVQAKTPWHIVRETCRLCITLRDSRDVACPSDASDELRDTYRQFQCLLYNCVCAAICRRRPGVKVYETCSELLKWRTIAPRDVKLPIRASWVKRNKSLPVAVPVETSSLLTSHSHMFLRTLSEHPMLFDLHSQQEEVPEIQDISLPETDLNAHPCAATMTAFFRHIATLPFAPTLWPGIVKTLDDGDVNMKWLVAQMICNCREELKPHASALLPSLLALVANTVDKKSLNGVHLDVLDTIITWKEPATSQHLNHIAHHLITTCMEYRSSSLLDALVKTLYGFLELYGSSIQIEWKTFEPYFEDKSQDTNKTLSRLIQLISKSKIYIPQVLDKILSKFDMNPSKMAECFGLALAVCQDATEKTESLARFKKLLEKCSVTNYVKLLYYSSLGCSECCGEFEFRKITDYVTKVSSYERTKCLHIIAIYLENARESGHCTDMFDTSDLSEMMLRDHTAMLVVKNGMHLMPEDLKRRLVLEICPYCQNSTVKVRKAALEVMLKAFEELFTQPFQPPAKRQKTNLTRILQIDNDDLYTRSIMACLGAGVTDGNDDVADIVREGVADRLDKELGVRFAECFLIVIYFPSLAKKRDLSACVAAMLQMLFSHLRSADNYKILRLRDEPLVLRESSSSSKLLTLSKAFQGTFSSYSKSRARKNKSQDTKSSIDVQVSIDSILQTLLDFAKAVPSAARALFSEVLRSILSSTSFDLAPYLVPKLGPLLGRAPTDVTPLAVDMCRVMLLHCSLDVTCLQNPASELKNVASGTEGGGLTSLLCEEITIVMNAADKDAFRLGIEEFRDAPIYETYPFSLEDLKSAFGKLSNWDNLTLGQRADVQSTLPSIWTDEAEFVTHLDSYQVPQNQSWLETMVLSLRRSVGTIASHWHNTVDAWPRRHFQISAVTEALSWRHDPSETMPVQRAFINNDCLAEWAARLMIRSCYHNSLCDSQSDKDRASQLSRSSELKWCERANEMGIPRIVLDCVKRNVEDLCDTEALPWLRQKLVALRQIGLETCNTDLLQDYLEIAKTQTPVLSTDSVVSLEMYHLMLLLHRDLNSLTYHDMQSILTQVTKTTHEVDWSKSPKTAVTSIFEIVMVYFDEHWDTGVQEKVTFLSNMADVFCQAVELNTPKNDMLLAVFLNKLDEYTGTMDAKTADRFLEKLSLLTPTLDTFSLELIKKNLSKFKTHLTKHHSLTRSTNDGSEKYRRCLQLVCDSAHLLMMYCEDLLTALEKKDANLWKKTFDRMKTKIYENPYTGPSYRLLDKYKEELYQIYEYDPSPDFTSKAKETLSSIRASLYKEPPSSLRLSDLCPALLLYRGGDSSHLCGLKDVVKFYDKVQVFTNSIRRPVVISMLLSNGRVARVIHKTGESLAGDAAAQRIARCTQQGYNVTLLAEDSALIEYLEGHDTVRSLIESAYDINVLSVRRPADRDLILTPLSASLQTHRELCAKVPPYALRSVIEQNSCSVEDFISKKQKFTDSLAHVIILTWILGLGDRHLQNIMCAQNGRLRCVDWGDVWRHGTTESPARLTRNLVAVCDARVLESRLETILGAARDSHRLLEAVIKVAFKWTGDRFAANFAYIQQILRGQALSYHIARDAIARCERLTHKDKRIFLLDSVLGHMARGDAYSVQSQVTCLLRHCTSPELLSYTRAGWEPWV